MQILKKGSICLVSWVNQLKELSLKKDVFKSQTSLIDDCLSSCEQSVPSYRFSFSSTQTLGLFDSIRIWSAGDGTPSLLSFITFLSFSTHSVTLCFLWSALFYRHFLLVKSLSRLKDPC